jgi:GNAT superfamily N-acetyltransferase
VWLAVPGNSIYNLVGRSAARILVWEGFKEMTTMDVSILDPHGLAAASDDLAVVYGAAFAQPPYNEPEEAAGYFAQILRRNAANPPAGFRCCVAREATSGELVGFGYGFTFGPGSSRYELLHRALASQPPEAAQRWLADAFDLVDLAVHPNAQGQGIGARLHDALLERQPHRTAVLTAYDGETVAMQLYRSRGWRPISGQMFFPGGTEPHLVLGLDLDGWRARADPKS